MSRSTIWLGLRQTCLWGRGSGDSKCGFARTFCISCFCSCHTRTSVWPSPAWWGLSWFRPRPCLGGLDEQTWRPYPWGRGPDPPEIARQSINCWTWHPDGQVHWPLQQSSLARIQSPHSGAWLQAWPITACGLRLDDEAIRVAVGLRLGVSLCTPTHVCVR